MARRWVGDSFGDERTFIELDEGEHYYRAFVEFDAAIAEFGEIKVYGTTFDTTSRTPEGARRNIRAQAKRDFPERTIVRVGEVREDDGAICKHCGVLNGH